MVAGNGTVKKKARPEKSGRAVGLYRLERWSPKKVATLPGGEGA